MSRLAKKPLIIPDSVEVSLKGNSVSIKGPKGSILRAVDKSIVIEIKDQEVMVTQKKGSRPALLGTAASLLKSDLFGVSGGFIKRLVIEGVGYKAQLHGKDLTLSLGFSHPITISAPEGISFEVEKNTIVVSGINKELVGNTAARIRAERPPEPYKGKGIRYEGEIVRRKAGKKAVGTAS